MEQCTGTRGELTSMGEKAHGKERKRRGDSKDSKR
jgi:hypothetical protein